MKLSRSGRGDEDHETIYRTTKTGKYERISSQRKEWTEVNKNKLMEQKTQSVLLDTRRLKLPSLYQRSRTVRLLRVHIEMTMKMSARWNIPLFGWHASHTDASYQFRRLNQRRNVFTRTHCSDSYRKLSRTN